MSLLGPAAALLSSCTWAVGTTVYARLAATTPAPAVQASRALVAGPVFLVLLLATGGLEGVRELASVPRPQLGYLALATLASYGLGDALFLLSARRLGVPAALAIASTFPLWAAVSGIVLLGEPAQPTRIAGVVAVVVGTVLVILSGRRHARSEPVRGRELSSGVLLAVATSGLWAVNSVCVRLGGAALPALVTSTWRLGFALVLCPAVGWLLRGRPPWPLFVPWQRLRPGLWAFLLEGVGGTFFFVYGTARSPLALGAPLTSLAPVLSLPVAWATRAEPASAAKALGIAVVTAGVVLLLA